MKHRDILTKLKAVVSSVVLPLLVLASGITVFRHLGTTTPQERPAIDQSLAGRMQRLSPADVEPVLSLGDVGGTLDIEAEGEVVPYREVQVATEVAGTVIYKAPACEAGSFVEKGDLLFRIDPTDYELEIRRLDSQKKAEYEAIREIDQELTNTERLIEVAKEDEELREREIARLTKLPQGFASDKEMDVAQQSRLQAVNTRVTLQNQLALLRKRRVRQETAEQLIETQLELARKNLERTNIHAPIRGVVYQETAEVNSFVARGTVILTLEDTSRAEVAVNLRVDQMYWVLDQASEGDEDTENSTKNYRLPRTPATVVYRMNGRNAAYHWEGSLERYDGIGVDAASRMIPVRVVVSDPDKLKLGGDLDERLKGTKALVRGMFVSVILHVTPRTPLSVVPNLAIQPGNRIWKFESDPAVLAPEPATPPAKIETKPDAPKIVKASVKQSPAETSAADGNLDQGNSADPETGGMTFDPTAWNAGRLEVLSGVVPITAVTLPKKSANGERGVDKFWICESRDGDLKPGDYVVVSPLGGVEGDGKDVIRVPKEML